MTLKQNMKSKQDQSRSREMVGGERLQKITERKIKGKCGIPKELEINTFLKKPPAEPGGNLVEGRAQRGLTPLGQSLAWFS